MAARRTVLIVSTLVGCWLAMQAVHEFGHMLGAWLTGARVERVILHPLAISRTDVAENTHPLTVVWAGPLVGVMLPLFLWLPARQLQLRGAFLLRFFAGFCLVANGLYIGVGSFEQVGDCHEMLRNGSALWHLWTFGTICTIAGFTLWNGLGAHFGLSPNAQPISPRLAWGSLIGCAILLLLEFVGSAAFQATSSTDAANLQRGD